MQMHSLTQTWTGIQRGRNWLKEEYGGFGGGRAPLLPPPRSLLFTLRQELILFAAFFLKKCQD